MTVCFYGPRLVTFSHRRPYLKRPNGSNIFLNDFYFFRIVHRTESAGSTANPCNAAENGYSISSIPENIKRDMKNNQLSSFRQYYYSMVKEMTKPCVGNAYKVQCS